METITWHKTVTNHERLEEAYQKFQTKLQHPCHIQYKFPYEISYVKKYKQPTKVLKLDNKILTKYVQKQHTQKKLA